jgi:hypothetical protein
MSKMWEYREMERDVEEHWFTETVLWELDDEKRRDRLFQLNMLGAEGWELIATRYIPVQPNETDRNPCGKLYETYKREMASGISVEERGKEIAEIHKSSVERSEELQRLAIERRLNEDK